jgi:hypothetical protein
MALKKKSEGSFCLTIEKSVLFPIESFWVFWQKATGYIIRATF